MSTAGESGDRFLELRGIYKTLAGERVLRGLDLSVCPGEIFM